MPRPTPRDEPVTNAERPTRSETIPSQPVYSHVSESYETRQMASLGVTSSLENKVARIPEIGQSGKNSVEISITIPKRNGTATQLTILDMDVHNSISVGSEFLNRIKAERRAIPDVVVNAKQVDRETLNEGRQVERCHIRFKGQLKSAPVEILCPTERNRTSDSSSAPSASDPSSTNGTMTILAPVASHASSTDRTTLSSSCRRSPEAFQKGPA